MNGTHVSGIAAGSGAASNGQFVGVAPGCGIVAVKILDESGKGDTAEFLAGIQWVISNMEKYNIRICNMSVGTDCAGGKMLMKAAEAAWDKGIVVCAAAGNNGPMPGSVTSPGSSRKVITVGCADDHKSVKIWGKSHVNFSGRGPTAECIVKPDVLAPGTNIVSCMSADVGRERLRELQVAAPGYALMSGTSMSTPAVSGVCALLLAKHPYLTPNQVKYMLISDKLK